jgi:hypothetical protein
MGEATGGAERTSANSLNRTKNCWSEVVSSGADVKLLFYPGLKFGELLLLVGFGDAGLTAGKKVTCKKCAQMGEVCLSEIHRGTFFDIPNEIVQVEHGISRLKRGFSELKVLPQILNGTVKALHPFYSRSSVGVDVVKNQFLAVKYNSDCGMPAIDGDILLQSITVDIAKRFLLAACGQEQLMAGDGLGDQKFADGGGTVEAGEDRKAFSNSGNFRSE